MALTPTTPIPLGFSAPDFDLLDVVSKNKITFFDVAGSQGTLVMFICNHCPFVVHVQNELVHLANDYIPKGIGFVAISSNDVASYTQDGPVQMAQLAESLDFPFPYLYDESQAVARAYHAACTPDFALFDKTGNCVYRGELDGSRPGNVVPCNGASMRDALDKMLDGKTVPEAEQRPSIGCGIKWK